MGSQTYFIGQRVILDGIHLGTVRFFGKVDGEDNNQNWVGIEWDDPSRGKHDGQFKDGPVLFQTRIPNSATFMKPSIRLGIGHSFLTSLKEKYLDDKLLEPSQVQNFTPEDEKMRQVALRFSQLDRLRMIGLESSKINGAGDDFELTELDGLLPSVETLDLSSNMFFNLNDISVIAGKLPRLKTLILSSNRFHLIPTTLPGLRNIQTLYLDSTLLTWQQSVQVAFQIEALSELHLSKCCITDLGIMQNSTGHALSIESLSVLTLDQNGLTDWGDLISSLRLFPQLQQLNLRRNNLRISSRDDEATTCQSLSSLSLVGNLIQLGVEIDHLRDWFPSLITLFLDGNPPDDSQNLRESRLLIIARFPTLVHLNGSQITLAERAEADVFYWSTIAKEVQDPNQLIKSHRRYLELLAKFGKTKLASTDERTSSLKAKMINLSIIWPDHVKNEKPKIQVLPSMTGRRFRIYLAKILRRCSPEYPQDLDELASNLELDIIINKDTGSNSLIDPVNDQKTLEWFGIANDDTLQVKVKKRE